MNKELFARKAGTRHIPLAQALMPQPDDQSNTIIDPTALRKIDPSIVKEWLDPNIFAPKICGLKEGCWEIEFTPTKRYLSPLLHTKYKGTLRIERSGFAHTISGDLYKFREYAFPLEKVGIPITVANKWQNKIYRPDYFRPDSFKPIFKKRCPIYARNKYHSYLEGTNISYSSKFCSNNCDFTLNFDQWYYTQPASGFNGDFANSADRSISMKISEVTSTHFTGTVYKGIAKIGTVSLRWCCKYFRTAHLEVFTLEGAEHPPTTVPDDNGGTESFETIFETAGWKLHVTRNSTKVPLPPTLAGTNINTSWSLHDLHDVMDSTPGYDNSKLDKKWRVFLISVPATLGSSRGVVFDQSTGDTNDIDREGSATFSHDGFNASHSSNFGVAEDELMKDWPRGFLRSAAHEVGHAFNQYHQNQQNSIMCPTPSVADSLAASGDTFPDDISLSFNDTIRHKLIHQPDPAVRPGAMDWGTAFAVPSADNVNFYDSDDLELEVKANKGKISIGEPLEVSWTVTNKMGGSINIPNSIEPDQHNTRISVTKPNGEIMHVRLPLDMHDHSHKPQTLAAGKSTSANSLIYWARKGFAFEQPGRHEINVILIWEENDIFFAVESSTEVWVNFPVAERDNEVASIMMNREVGRFVLTRNSKKYPDGLKRIEKVVSKHKNHEVSKAVESLLDPKDVTRS